MFSPESLFSKDTFSLTVVLYRVDIEVMSRPDFKCRAAFVAQGGNPVQFFTNLSVNVSSFFR